MTCVIPYRVHTESMEELRLERSTDDVSDAVADDQRRELLLALLEDGPQDDWRAVVPGTEAGADSVERTVAMRHVHLPKLEDFGFIDWDPRSDAVTKGRNFDDVEPLLELLADHDDERLESWS